MNKSIRIEELDVLRGFAAVLVLFFHFTLFRDAANYGFIYGITGVDLFFIISGFVIFMSIENSKNANLFLVFRFIRLYPIYWIIATFTFLLFWFLTSLNAPVPYVEIPVKDYLINLSMVQYFFGVNNIDGSYWTLIIELVFYVLIFVLFKVRLINKIIVIGVVFCTVSVFWVFAIRNFHLSDYSSWFPLLYHFPMFFIGIVFYKISKAPKKEVWYYLIIVGAISSQVYLMDYGRAFHFISAQAYAIVLILYCFIFYLFTSNKLGFLVARPTVFLGKISYALYLIHQPLSYGIVIPFFTDYLHWNFWVVCFGIALPLCLALATFFTFKVDEPIRSFLKRKVHLKNSKKL